ncbi:MAG: hypothetical protein ACOCZV_00075 [Nanoarchaeota archaeon]
MDSDTCFSSLGFSSKQAFCEVFGPVSISEKEDCIDELTETVRESYEIYTSFLESIIQPDSSLIQMNESSEFTDDLRAKAYELYREMLRVLRSSLKTGLTPTEDVRFSHLKDLVSRWPSFARELEPLVECALSSWKPDKKIISGEEKYFG